MARLKDKKFDMPEYNSDVSGYYLFADNIRIPRDSVMMRIEKFDTEFLEFIKELTGHSYEEYILFGKYKIARAKIDNEIAKEEMENNRIKKEIDDAVSWCEEAVKNKLMYFIKCYDGSVSYKLPDKISPQDCLRLFRSYNQQISQSGLASCNFKSDCEEYQAVYRRKEKRSMIYSEEND